MLQKVLAVATDYEGPCVFNDWLHELAYEFAAKEQLDWNGPLNFVELTRRSGISNVIGGGGGIVAKAILKVVGRTDITAEQLNARKAEIYDKMLEDIGDGLRDCVVPGFVDAIQKLQKTDIPVGICSLTPTQTVNKMIERSGLGGLFPLNMRITLDSVGTDPVTGEVLKKSASRGKGYCWWEFAVRVSAMTGIAISPRDMLVVGDSPADVESWRDCGVRCEHMIGIPQSKEVTPLLVEAGLPEAQIFPDWNAVMESEQFGGAFNS
jgi:phosphoglycolate phosphatase-like HAD superfamily hydrolase